MKKLLIAALCIIAVSACKEDEPVVSNGYPTDGLTLEPKKNALLMMGYKFNLTPTAASHVIRAYSEHEYKGRVNHLSLVTDAAEPFYNPLTDSLLNYFQSPTWPYFVVNDEILDATNPLPEELEMELTGKPVVSLKHVVSQNDTSWVVDTKIKFFEDTLVQPNAILIETYMAADIRARVFGSQGMDLRFTATKDLIKNTDSASFWDLNLYSEDSSSVIIKKEDPVYHNYIFLENNNPDNILGTPLSEYWSFSGDYHEGDIIGTADTPIRHHFKKPEKGEFTFDRKLRFVTVIWIFDPVSSTYKYLNSYSTGNTY